MKIHTKRWRRAMRRKFRGSRKRALAFIRSHPEPSTDREIEIYNYCVEHLNKLVRYPREQGMATIDGAIACPKCGRGVICFADPHEWHIRPHPVWRRRRRQGARLSWRVTCYWGGTGQCCGLLLAFQPDGRAEAYQLEEAS